MESTNKPPLPYRQLIPIFIARLTVCMTTTMLEQGGIPKRPPNNTRYGRTLLVWL